MKQYRNTIGLKDCKADIYYIIGPQFHITIVKVFQLVGEFVPRTPTGALPQDPTGASPRPPAVCRATFQTVQAPITAATTTTFGVYLTGPIFQTKSRSGCVPNGESFNIIEADLHRLIVLSDTQPSTVFTHINQYYYTY